MRAAAIDFGTVRIGLAVADELGLLAHPRPPLDGRDPEAALQALARLAEEEQIDLFVVGIPRAQDGTEGPMARQARRFANQLQTRTGRPVDLSDEWFTTREAEQRLRSAGVRAKDQRRRVDSAAAAVLLQSYLDGNQER